MISNQLKTSFLILVGLPFEDVDVPGLPTSFKVEEPIELCVRFIRGFITSVSSGNQKI